MMEQNQTLHKQKILIADDNEMNRAILADMLEAEFEIVEAADGVQAVSILNQMGTTIALVLLDIVMPNMDGYEVLAMMNKQRWIEDIPVIMISAENRSAYIERAYELGVCDFISRPFDALVVHRRVSNTIMLYAKQKKLVGMVADQIYEREKSSNLMISILSHIVEFRNGESGRHVLHIHVITELLLKHLVRMTDQYHLTKRDISLIVTASALHDIGKIGIPGEILNKPGKLTPEEFEIMKSHSMVGASMLKGLELHREEPLVKTAYEICRWHHERYDGQGYPDGLKGEAIPISAQIVALADVYDALTSERVYKAAYSHEKALEMILNGECGAFNPLLLECLSDIADTIQDELEVNSLGGRNRRELSGVMEEMLQHEELSASERPLRLLEQERSKYRFFADMSHEIQFEYTCDPPVLTLSEWGAAHLELEELVMEPENDPELLSVLGRQNLDELIEALHKTTMEQPVTQLECKVMVNGEPRWYRIVCRATWTEEETPRLSGVIGKATDIHDEYVRMADLRYKASHDALTGLWNRSHARERIMRYLKNAPESKYAMMLIDLDCFKKANDQYGHMFGDQVLQHTAERLLQSIRNEDIGARIGGDEFLIFLEYTGKIEPVAERIFRVLTGNYAQFPIRISMGISLSEQEGNDYDTLLRCADQALYTAKRDGRGQYRLYDTGMKDMFSVISPIDSDGAEAAQDL